jgi:ATP-dependent protease ClpP protease subunit
MEEILAHHTGQPVEQVHLDTERDNFMSAEAARSYGLIDNIIVNREDEPQWRVGLANRPPELTSGPEPGTS